MPSTGITGKQVLDSTVDLSKDVFGILPVANGGTGSTSGGSGGGAASVRSTTTYTTPVLAAGASHDFQLSIGKTGLLLGASTSVPTWLRAYRTVADRVSDSTRVLNSDPGINSGILSEFVTVSGLLSINFARPRAFANMESVPVSSIPCRIVNTGDTSVAITLNMIALTQEN